ncbi:LAMP3 protein, partial [Zapornia atra]|nr:LAMP3 protein [Zapornia atra]
HVSSEETAAATNTTIKHTTSNTQGTAATLSTAATTVQTVKPTTTWLGNQTTPPKHPTATATTNTTTVHPGTQTTIPTTTTSVRPTLTPPPSSIPIGTYTVASGNETCIRAVMGLQLMARNMHTEQMEYRAVNPKATEMSGSCGTAQSQLNLTFSGGFINFTFVK